MAAQLELALGREVDLIELNRAPPDLLHEVLRDGEVLLDRDPAFRVRQEVRARAHLRRRTRGHLHSRSLPWNTSILSTTPRALT